MRIIMLGCGHICSLDSIICLLACKRKASTINCIMILDQFTVWLLVLLHCIIHACNIFCHLLQLSACDVCQRMNRKLTTGTPQLNPIAVKAPWHMLGIDFVGPISPPATDGSVYILTITDYFTKWVEAVPTTNKEASSVATCLFKVCKHVHK